MYLKDQQRNDDFIIYFAKKRSMDYTDKPQLLNSPHFLKVKFKIIKEKRKFSCFSKVKTINLQVASMY